MDGAWSSWGEFGPCSVTCSDGFRSRFRSCDNPPPADGGDTCPGPGEDKEPCKDKECPGRNIGKRHIIIMLNVVVDVVERQYLPVKSFIQQHL